MSARISLSRANDGEPGTWMFLSALASASNKIRSRRNVRSAAAMSISSRSLPGPGRIPPDALLRHRHGSRPGTRFRGHRLGRRGGPSTGREQPLMRPPRSRAEPATTSFRLPLSSEWIRCPWASRVLPLPLTADARPGLLPRQRRRIRRIVRWLSPGPFATTIPWDAVRLFLPRFGPLEPCERGSFSGRLTCGDHVPERLRFNCRTKLHGSRLTTGKDPLGELPCAGAPHRIDGKPILKKDREIVIYFRNHRPNRDSVCCRRRSPPGQQVPRTSRQRVDVTGGFKFTGVGSPCDFRRAESVCPIIVRGFAADRVGSKVAELWASLRR